MLAALSLRLPDKTAKALHRLASATERPKTDLIVKAVESYIADCADYQIAFARLRNKNDAIISGAELRKRFVGKN